MFSIVTGNSGSLNISFVSKAFTLLSYYKKMFRFSPKNYFPCLYAFTFNGHQKDSFPNPTGNFSVYLNVYYGKQVLVI